MNDTAVELNSSSCGSADLDNFLDNFAFWTEGVLEIAVCLTGLVANCLMVPILFTKRMSSIFNRLLVFLTIFDNMFITCCILEAIRKFFYTSDFQIVLLVYGIYPLQNIAITCSTYATVVLAVERYWAVSRPVEYHIMVNASGINPWKRVWSYMAPTILFGFIFNLPRYLELYTIDEDQGGNETSIQIKPTDLRLDENYVFYYLHLSRLFVTGIFPFLSLVILNKGVHNALKKRRKNNTNLTGNRTPVANNNTAASAPPSAGSSSHEAEETRQSLVLLVIVLLFLVCHLPRIALNTFEVFTVNSFKANVNNRCFRLPTWVVITTSLSLLLMTINSSVNFFIYCFVNTTFKTEFLRVMKNCLNKICFVRNSRCNNTSTNTHNTTASSHPRGGNQIRNSAYEPQDPLVESKEHNV